MSGKKIVVLGTGGTIAGLAATADDNTGYTAGQIGVREILATVPHLAQALQGLQLDCEQLAQLDSKDMDFDTMLCLARRCTALLTRDDVKSVVVTHGTDTLEETAYFLHRCLAASADAQVAGKAVVLTCAMRPASSLEADGPGNLHDAVLVAVDSQARGVMVVCAGDVHHPVLVQKVHSSALNPFASGALTLDKAGLLAQVRGAKVYWEADRGMAAITTEAAWQADNTRSAFALMAQESPQPIPWPRVVVLLNHCHAGASHVHALIHHQQPSDPLRGIVVAGTGNGTLAQALQTALLEAQALGIRVLRASRCAFGGVIPVARDLLTSTQLSWAKARIELVFELLAQDAEKSKP